LTGIFSAPGHLVRQHPDYDAYYTINTIVMWEYDIMREDKEE
jgi:hypothetical protein